MADTKQINDDKYAGPSKTIEVLGKGNAYGWIGSISGGIIGGVVTAFTTRESTKWTAKAAEFIEWISFGKLHVNGKWAIIAGGALLGSQIGHFTGLAIGLDKGAKTAGHGQEQFKRIKSERDQAKAELDALKNERDTARKEDTKVIELPKGTERDSAEPSNTVHAAAIEDEKKATSEIAR